MDRQFNLMFVDRLIIESKIIIHFYATLTFSDLLSILEYSKLAIPPNSGDNREFTVDVFESEKVKFLGVFMEKI